MSILVLLAKCFSSIVCSKVYTLCKFRFHLVSPFFEFYDFFFLLFDKTKSLKLAGVRKLKTKNKQNRNYCDCFSSLSLSRSENCSKFAFIQKKSSLSLALSQTNHNYKSKKTAFLNVFFVFLWKCVPWRFFLLQFYLIHFFHFSLLSRSLVRFVVRSLVSQRFIQKTIVRLSVCVLHLRVLFCVSVLFSFFYWVCICDLPCVWFCCSIKSLIWYKFHR